MDASAGSTDRVYSEITYEVSERIATVTLNRPRSCDFRPGSTDSKFGFVFGRRGIFPEGGSTWYLPRQRRYRKVGFISRGQALRTRLAGHRLPDTNALTEESSSSCRSLPSSSRWP